MPEFFKTSKLRVSGETMTCLLCLVLGLFVPAARAAQTPARGVEQPAAQSAGEKVYLRKEVDTPAKVTHRQPPNFPSNDAGRIFRGTVRVRAVLGADGKVSGIEVLGAVADEVRRTSIEAVRKTKFKPALKGGRAVSQYATFEHNYGVE